MASSRFYKKPVCLVDGRAIKQNNESGTVRGAGMSIYFMRLREAERDTEREKDRERKKERVRERAEVR